MNIKFINPFKNNEDLFLEKDGLKDREGKIIFPIIAGACRVLENTNNYTDNFGFQWNKFTKTQIDSKNENTSQSTVRFFTQTNWDKENLSNKKILEVGSGAGRFSQVVLDNTVANLYSVDYSSAVEANFKNNGHHIDRFKLFQASVYEMPFAKAQFDKVFCFGVLQHTPNIEETIKSLISMVKPGGELVVDFYEIKGWWTKICAKYILRPFVKKWSDERLFNKIEKNIDWMIKFYKFLFKIKLGFLTRFIPIVDIYGTFPKNLTPTQLREWCVLDTFDMFSPEYDQPQRISTITKYLNKYGMQNVWGGQINVKGCMTAVVKGSIKTN